MFNGHTVKDVIDFLRNGSNPERILQDWTDEDLALAINRSIEDNALGWCSDESGRLCGVAIGYKENESLHIAGIYVDRTRCSLKDLLRIYWRLYPHYILKGLRDGKTVIYKRLCKDPSKKI